MGDSFKDTKEAVAGAVVGELVGEQGAEGKARPLIRMPVRERV